MLEVTQFTRLLARKAAGRGGQLDFICMAHSQQAQREGLVLAGPAMVAAKPSEASIQGKDQLWSLSASLGGPRSGCGRGWDRSHYHIPGSGGRHHSWSKHWPQARCTSVSPELNASIAPRAPEMGFSKLVHHPKEQPSTEGFGPAWAKSQPVPTALDGQEPQDLLLPIHLGEREDASAVPSRNKTPAPTSSPWPNIYPPGPESSRLSWLSAGHSDVPGTIYTGDDWGR